MTAKIQKRNTIRKEVSFFSKKIKETLEAIHFFCNFALTDIYFNLTITKTF